MKKLSKKAFATAFDRGFQAGVFGGNIYEDIKSFGKYCPSEQIEHFEAFLMGVIAGNRDEHELMTPEMTSSISTTAREFLQDL
jgi:hypothetical protein